MTFNAPLYSSVTDAVIDLLRADTGLQAMSVDNIGRDLIGYDRDKKWIVVSRQGGSYAFPKHPHPRIDISCYAPSSGTAEDLIDKCVQVVLTQQGTYRNKGIILCAAKIETAPFEATDKLAASVRYVVAFRLTVRPDPSP